MILGASSVPVLLLKIYSNRKTNTKGIHSSTRHPNSKQNFMKNCTNLATNDRPLTIVYTYM